MRHDSYKVLASVHNITLIWIFVFSQDKIQAERDTPPIIDSTYILCHERI